MNKTNALRILDSNKINYEVFESVVDENIDAISVAKKLGANEEQVFKTLVCVASSKEHYVFVLPGTERLDLKKAAKLVNEKSVEMIPQKELLPLTGYVHGGCSPLGMKKEFKTIIDETCILYEMIYVSAGKIGMQVKISPDDLCKVINASIGDLKKDSL